jgi:hypothetical protein
MEAGETPIAGFPRGPEDEDEDVEDELLDEAEE